MKILLALSTLTAAALCAVIFPEMKKLLALIPFALLALAFTACGSTSRIEQALRKLPDGHADKFTVGGGNLGVSASITGAGLDKQGNAISAELLNATVSTPWSGQWIFNLENWKADVSPDARKPRVPAVPVIPALAPGFTLPPPPVPPVAPVVTLTPAR